MKKRKKKKLAAIEHIPFNLNACEVSNVTEDFVGKSWGGTIVCDRADLPALMFTSLLNMNTNLKLIIKGRRPFLANVSNVSVKMNHHSETNWNDVQVSLYFFNASKGAAGDLMNNIGIPIKVIVPIRILEATGT